MKDDATIKKDDKSKGSKFEPLKHQLLSSVLIKTSDALWLISSLYSVLCLVWEYFPHAGKSMLLQNLGLCSALTAFEQGGSLSCHICDDMGPQFTKSSLKDHPVLSQLKTSQGYWDRFHRVSCTVVQI